jgi:hypothetical protein
MGKLSPGRNRIAARYASAASGSRRCASSVAASRQWVGAEFGLIRSAARALCSAAGASVFIR